MNQSVVNSQKIEEVLTRGVETIYPSRDELRKALASGRRLRIYLGADPTGVHLHLGTLTNLLTLKRLQSLGHEIIFLIGDFTAQIGDPTDKLSARQPLAPSEIKANMKTFKTQVGRILRFSGRNAARLELNSKWLSKMTLKDVLELTQKFTVQQMIIRDMFQERIKENKPVGVHEFLYPLMQGYDSVAMDVDAEVGGNDQTFNMLVGRDLLRTYKNKEKFVITTRLLLNPKTGKKLMNKSEGGMINLDDDPAEMFGKIMALDDSATTPLAEFSSEISMEDVRSLSSLHPRDAKLKVACAVVKTIFGEVAAKKAEASFVSVFSKKEDPKGVSLIHIGRKNASLIDIVMATNFVSSKNEAKRLIIQGGVKIDGMKKLNEEEMFSLEKELLLQIGKHHFVRIGL